MLSMTWHDLLFAHWRVPKRALTPVIPTGLALDTFEGEAWLGVVPFRMTGVKPRGCLPIPRLSSFLELNVRTYVVAGGKPGVWFFSLDASSRLAVRAARCSFHLPYFDARMKLETKNETVTYRSERVHRNAPRATLRACYRGVGSPRKSEPGSLEHWLTERYCLYAADKRGRVYRGDIHHAPWPLRDAEADFETLDMTRLIGIDALEGAPLLRFAERLDVVAWLLEPIALPDSTC